MPVLQFWNKNDSITLLKGVLKNITDEPRAKIMPRDSFISSTYQIEKGLFIAKSSMIMKLVSLQDKSIDALYFYYKDSHVIIVPSKTYIFYNGKSVEPATFSV